MCNKIMSVIIATAVWGALANVASAKSVTINVSSPGVATRGSEAGNYYVVQFDPPNELSGKRVDRVFLDFVVDIAATNEDGDSLKLTPLISVYPLTAEPGEGDPAYDSDFPTMRPVPVGEAQPIRSDITEIAKGWMANPSSNHGLIITSLAGHAMSVCVDSGAFGPGNALQVTFFYQNRFGGRVSGN